MRRWLWLACLALAGCNEDWRIVSASPDLPVAELATPAGLPGAYWQLDRDSEWKLRGTRFGRDAAGRSYTIDIGDPDSLARMRLVTLPVENGYLLVGDSGPDSEAEYLLLHDRGNGVIELSGLFIDQTTPFLPQNDSWRDMIAARHGLTIDPGRDGESNDSARIDGEIGGMKIPMLFRDPAFLATLEISPIRYFLRAGGKAPELQNAGKLGVRGDQKELTFAGPIIVSPQDTVQPEGLAGEYVSESTCCIRITARDDGLFEGTVADWGGKMEFAVMPVDEDADDAYLALMLKVDDPPDETEVVDEGGEEEIADESEDGLVDETTDDEDEAESSTGPQLIYLSRSDDCWIGIPVALRRASGFAEIEAMRAAQMAQAAARHGLGFADGHVDSGGGAVTSQQIRALVGDGQFTSGLDMASGDSESIKMCFSTPSPDDEEAPVAGE